MLTGTYELPDASDTCAVCKLRFPGLVPYANQYVVANPLGSTYPINVAPVEVMLLAEYVATDGGTVRMVNVCEAAWLETPPEDTAIAWTVAVALTINGKV